MPIPQASTLFLPFLAAILHTAHSLTLNQGTRDTTTIEVAKVFRGEYKPIDIKVEGDDIVLKPGIRKTDRHAGADADEIASSCSAWEAVYRGGFSEFNEGWVGICNGTDIARMNFHYYKSFATIRHQAKVPNARKCFHVAAVPDFEFHGAICEIATSTIHDGEPGNLYFIALNSTTLEQISMSQLPVKVLDVKRIVSMAVVQTLDKNIRFLAIANNFTIYVDTFDTNTLMFSPSVRGIVRPATNYDEYDLVKFAVADKNYFTLAIQHKQTITLYLAVQTYSQLEGGSTLTPLHSLDAMVLYTQSSPPDRLLAVEMYLFAPSNCTVTVVTESAATVYNAMLYNHTSSARSFRYEFGKMKLASVIKVQQFQKSYNTDIVITGLEPGANEATVVFCSEVFAAVQISRRQILDPSFALAQVRGLMQNNYEVMIVGNSVKDTNTRVMHILSVGTPIVTINSSNLTTPATQKFMPILKREAIVFYPDIENITKSYIVEIDTTFYPSPKYPIKEIPTHAQIKIHPTSPSMTLIFPSSFFRANFPAVQFKLSNLEGHVEMLHAGRIGMKAPSLPADILRLTHMGMNFFSVQYEKEIRVLSCGKIFQDVRCSNVVSAEMDPAERYLKTAYHDGGFLILTGVGSNTEGANDCKTRLRVIDILGFDIIDPVEWAVCPLQGTIRERDSITYIEILGFEFSPNIQEQSRNFIYSANFTNFEDIPDILGKNRAIPDGICPTWISWGYSRLFYLNIDSFCPETGHYLYILDVAPNTFSSAKILDSFKVPIDHKTYMCSTGTDMVSIDASTGLQGKLRLYRRTTTGVTKALDFPFEEYGLYTIQDFTCVPDESFVLVLAVGLDGNSYLAAYRYTESAEPYNRGHSIIKVNVTAPAAISAGQINADNELLVLVVSRDEGYVQGYWYSLEGPKAIININHTQKINSQGSLEILLSGYNTEDTPKTSSLQIDYTDQPEIRLPSREGSSPTLPKVSSWRSKTTIDLDGLFAGQFTLKGAHLKGIAKEEATVLSRFRELPIPKDMDMIEDFRGIKVYENIVVLWNYTDLHVHEEGSCVMNLEMNRTLTVNFIANASVLRWPGKRAIMVTDLNTEGIVELIIIIKSKDPSNAKGYNWTSHRTKMNVNYQNIQGVFIESSMSTQTVFSLVGHCKDSRILYQSFYTLRFNHHQDPNYESLHFARMINLFPFPTHISMFTLAVSQTSTNPNPIVVASPYASGKLYLIQPRTLTMRSQTRYQIYDYGEDLGGTADCQDLMPRPGSDLAEWICTVFSSSTNKGHVFRIKKESDTKSTTLSEISKIRSLDWIGGFTALKVVTTANYIAIYGQNHKINPNSGTQGVHKLSQAVKSDDNTVPTLAAEKSIIVVYKTISEQQTPYLVVPQSKFEPYSSAPLISVYFDIEEFSNKVFVNLRYQGNSALKIFEISPLQLQINDWSRLHLKRSTLVLEGIDSTQEITLEDLLTRNTYRIVIIWLLILTITIASLLTAYHCILKRSKYFKREVRRIRHSFRSSNSRLPEPRLVASIIGEGDEYGDERTLPSSEKTL